MRLTKLAGGEIIVDDHRWPYFVRPSATSALYSHSIVLGGFEEMS